VNFRLMLSKNTHTFTITYALTNTLTHTLSRTYSYTHTLTHTHAHSHIKGLVHPKMKIKSYSPTCCSNPVRPSFIFGTQIKIFLI